MVRVVPSSPVLIGSSRPYIPDDSTGWIGRGFPGKPDGEEITMTLIEALEELMGEVEHHDVACADTGGVRIFEEEEWTDTKGVHATCQTLHRVLQEVARGEMTIEALIREIGAPQPVQVDAALDKAREMMATVEADETRRADEGLEPDPSIMSMLVEDLEHEAAGDSSRGDPLDCEMWVLRVKRRIEEIQEGEHDV
jgi:hypothetical protein